MILKIRLSGEAKRWDEMVDKLEEYLIAEKEHKLNVKYGGAVVEEEDYNDVGMDNKEKEPELDLEAYTADKMNNRPMKTFNHKLNNNEANLLKLKE